MSANIATVKEIKPSAKAQKLCRQFSLAEIQLATSDFSDERLLGRGGFGKVYKGLFDNGRETMAIKRLDLKSNQGEGEFVTEIETLSHLRHDNLVSLIGYCNENGEMILVYEYMACGTLGDHIFGNTDGKTIVSLHWNDRLKICIGAGRGLDYLHTGRSLIHRDIKASNILLDEDFTAKVADFGLAKYIDKSKPETHVSTMVKGTFGYLDPYYFTTGRLTKQSDTYSFGVVLLEIMTGKPAVDPSRIFWAREMIRKGKLGEIIDSNLNGEISEGSLKVFVDIAKKCFDQEPKKRPRMGQVLLQLELALEQQDRSSNAKPPRLWQWTAFWNRTPPGESELLVPGTSQGDQHNVKIIKTAGTATLVDEIKESPDSPTSDASIDKQTISIQQLDVPAIPFVELRSIANDFCSTSIIGEGPYGKTYHGVMKNGQAVAIKKIDTREQLDKFSNLKHENVVELLGYCVFNCSHFLVYEYSPNESLYDILHGNPLFFMVLSWTQRVKVAVGIARGLEYIHENTQIHGAIMSSNVILFDDYDVTKIAGFNIPSEAFLLEDPDPLYYHPSFHRHSGYESVEYKTTGQGSDKSDIYSFGVILLELLTGRKPVDHTQPRFQQDLVTWAKPRLNKEKVNHVVDPKLSGAFPPKAVAKMASVAALCVQHEADFRPSMRVVVKALQPLLKT